LIDVPFEILLDRLELRNQQAGDDVTFIPVSKMYEYLPGFESPDAQKMALKFNSKATNV